MGANMGSLYSRIAGSNHPVTGLPRNVALFPRAVEASAQAEENSFGKFTSSGGLGSSFAPFVPGSGGEAQRDMSLSLPQTRLDDRRTLLLQLDRIKRSLDTSCALDGLIYCSSRRFKPSWAELPPRSTFQKKIRARSLVTTPHR